LDWVVHKGLDMQRNETPSKNIAEGQPAGVPISTSCHTSSIFEEGNVQYAGISVVTLLILACILREIRLLIEACRT
jgi:hypothetical protein